MANQANQKEKLLRIRDILERETDEEHPLTAGDIIRKLKEFGITAERKSIYRDLAVLDDYGMDIMKAEDGRGWYLASRDFELPELKLLVDAVSASKFISEKKSRDLVKKIEMLGSTYEGKDLHRQVVVADRAKSENESIYYSIDTIYKSIDEQKQMRFRYFSWNGDKEKDLRNAGAYYVVSPAFLLWVDENYYLVAYSHKDQEIRHYRVDKMVQVEALDFDREGKEVINGLKKSDYARRTFNMYAGQSTLVTLVGEAYMANVLMDRFGSDINMHKTPDGRIIAHVNVEESTIFYGWLAGLGTGIQIKSPESVKENYRKHLKKILACYE